MSCLTQPSSVEIKIVDDIFIKSMEIARAGTFVPQHSHTYDHVSMLAVGSVRVWADDELLGDYHAPAGILIKSHTMHRFLSLVDNTLIYCIHRIHDGEDGVNVHKENKFREVDYVTHKLVKEI